MTNKFTASALHGEIVLPGDKSISHRAFFLGAATKGAVQISNLNLGRDVLATVNALRAVGVSIELDGSAARVSSTTLQDPKEPVDCQNSGTTTRLFSGVCAGARLTATLVGDTSLSRRPMEPLAAQLRAFGARIETTDGHLPMSVHGREKLQTQRFILLSASAQIKSALLLAGTYREVPISILNDANTRDHTERMLRALGAEIEFDGRTIELRASALRPTDIRVPGDLSAAAFFIVAAALTGGSDITLKDIGVNPTRTGAIDILRNMGAQIELSNLRAWGDEPVADIRVRPSTLHATSVDASLTVRAIDEIPVLAVAAAFAQGQTRFSNIGELRSKESDRVAAIEELLAAVGIQAQSDRNTLTITGGKPIAGNRIIQTRGDHRIAMSAAALAAAAGPIGVDDTTSTDVSFPGFSALWNTAQA